MVQTVKSILIPSGQQKIVIEKPHILNRIFYSIRALADLSAWCESRLSMDDPMFLSYYTLAGPFKFFEAKGEGIFQGDIWVHNISNIYLLYTVSEILI